MSWWDDVKKELGVVGGDIAKAAKPVRKVGEAAAAINPVLGLPVTATNMYYDSVRDRAHREPITKSNLMGSYEHVRDTARDIAKVQKNRISKQHPSLSDEPQKSTDSRGGVGGAGRGNLTTPREPDPWYYSGDEIASRFGIENDYDTLRDEYQDVAAAKIAESESMFQKLQGSLGRQNLATYDQYLSDLRHGKQTAAVTGAAKGLQAAEQIGSVLGMGQQQSEIAQSGYDMTRELALAKGVAMEEAQTFARQAHQKIAQHLSNVGMQYEANDINRYIGELSAQAQEEAARLQAQGSVSASKAAAESQNRFMLKMVEQAQQGHPVAESYLNTFIHPTRDNITASTAQILEQLKKRP